MKHIRNELEVNGISTSFVDEGSGRPIVLIHGGDPGRSTESLVTWNLNIDGLAKDHRVIALDRPGHGFSDPLTAPADIRMSVICEHVAAFMRELNVGPATIVGQSRGAFIAAYLGMKHPDLVERLVLVNSTSFSPNRLTNPQEILANFKCLPETAWNDEAWLSVSHEHITDEWVHDAKEMASSPARIAARDAFQAEVADQYYQEFDAVKSELLEWYREHGCSTPALVVWGLGDPIANLEDGLSTFKHLQGGAVPPRMYLMDRAGHHCFAERPLEFNALIANFIALVEPVGKNPL